MQDSDYRNLYWAALSHVLLQQGKKDIGKAAGHWIAKQIGDYPDTIKAPYFSSRRPAAWQSLTGRLMVAYLFAWNIIDATPEERRSEVNQLKIHAVNFSLDLFRTMGLSHPDDGRAYLRLVMACLWHRQQIPALQTELITLGQDEALSGGLRAVLLWSDDFQTYPAEVQADAMDLFRAVLMDANHTDGRDHTITWAVSLLDIAMAKQKPDMRSKLVHVFGLTLPGNGPPCIGKTTMTLPHGWIGRSARPVKNAKSSLQMIVFVNLLFVAP